MALSIHASRLAGPAILVTCTMTVFGGALLPDEALFARDVFNYYFPARSRVAEAYGQGTAPVWDASQQVGIPVAGDIHAAPFYPGHALYQVLSFPRAYGLLLILHHLLMGVGMFVLLRRLLLD